MHFAASCYVGESVQDPAKYYVNNLIGTLNLLEASAARARAELGWSPEFDDLSDIVETAWRWFSRQPAPVIGS